MAASPPVCAEIYRQRLQNMNAKIPRKDAKTRLQEYQQAKQPLPIYKVVSITGKDHQQQFEVSCQIAQLPSLSLPAVNLEKLLNSGLQRPV